MVAALIDGVDAAGLRLLIGPPNAGKLGFVPVWYERLAARAPVVVVPTHPDVDPLTLELTRRVGPLFGACPVCTFADLVAARTRPSAAQSPPPASALERALLMEPILRETQFEAFGSVSSFPGAVEAALRLVQELREGELDPQGVEHGLQRWSLAGGGAVAGDAGRLVSAYDDRLARAGRCDQADVIRRAIVSCAEWRRPVALYGFDSFTPVQRSLVRMLAARVPVLMVLTHDSGRAVQGAVGEEVALWQAVADVTVRVPRQLHAFASPELAELDRLYLSAEGAASTPSAGSSASAAEPATPSAGPPAGASAPCAGLPPEAAVPESAPRDDALGDGVRLLLSSGRRNEVESVGGEVVRLMRAGISADEIVVLVRRVAPWRRLVEQVFRSYGIPHRVDAEIPFFETGLGQALINALRGAATADLDRLLAYLRSPYHNGGHATVDELEVGLRRTRNTRGPTMLAAVSETFPEALAGLGATLSRDEGGDLVVDPDALARVVWQMVQEAARAHPFGSTELEEDVAAGAAATAALEQLAQACRAGWGPTAARATAARAAVATEGAHAAATAVAAEVEAVLGVLRGVAVRTGHSDERGVVQVMSASRVRARRFLVVFVMGLVEGEFPEAGRPPSLLGEAERRQANRDAGVRLFAEPVEGEEAALFCQVLSRPWQLLYLSTRDAEEDGKETVQSPYWIEVQRLLGDRAPWRRRTLRDVTHPADTAPSMREYLRACAIGGMRPEDAAQRRALEQAPPWRCDPDRLCLPATLTVLAAQEVFAATDLEEYARCPFSWFMGRLVRPGELEERLSGLHRGTVVHRVLADMYQTLKAEGLTPLTGAALPRAEELLQEHVERRLSVVVSLGSAGELRLLSWEVSRLVRGLLSFDAARAGSYAPVDLEYALPRGGVDLGGFRVSGRIDRIDAAPGGSPMFLIDYKSGSEAYGPRFADKGALQVPLYLAALRALRPEVELAGGAYVALSGMTVRGAVRSDMADDAGGWLPATCRVDRDRFEAEIDACVALAQQAVEGIRQGRIPAEPAEKCRAGCVFRPICRTRRKVERWG